MVLGVSAGFTKDLEIVGVGYRATAQGPGKIELALGFSHSVPFEAPAGITFDVPLPGPEVFDEVQRLVRNLIEMNAILRDRERCSIRLVLNPDRMVIKEAQRTFTYLNLYGYLTDAVIVNRIFPDDVEGGYFDAWHGRQRQHLEEVREGFAPVPVLTSRYFEEEVVGSAMLDRLGPTAAALDPDGPEAIVLTSDGEARPLPFWKRPLSWRQVMLLAVPMFLLACLLLVLAGAIAIGCLSAMGPSPGI